MKVKYFIVLILIVFISGCRENPPAIPDGECGLIIKAWYANPDSHSSVKYLPAANAKVVLSSEYGIMVNKTDASGLVHITGIPAAVYRYSVTMDHPFVKGLFFTAPSKEIELSAGKTFYDTVYSAAAQKGRLCINEIYISGPSGAGFWYYDQFIELYNGTSEVKYLDGCMVMRLSGNTSSTSTNEYHKGPGADEGEDGDIDGVMTVFKFPGNPGERNYPFNPGSFLTIAMTAMDYTKLVKNSIDLSLADWEFYNPADAADTDSPFSQNLINMRDDQTGAILFGLPKDVVVISNGRDTNWEDGIDIKTVIDGVQYSLSGQKNPKTLDVRVDKSYAMAPPTYSGKSMQRRQPGLDTDDAMLDWEIISKPTPGRQ